MPEIDVDHLPKWRQDWLEVFGNTFKPAAVLPGTCEACVYGERRYSHNCGRVPQPIGAESTRKDDAVTPERQAPTKLTIFVRSSKPAGRKVNVHIL